MSPPALLLEGFTLPAGSPRRLGPISVSVGPGERIAVAGPSGAGKSTLLLALAGRIGRGHSGQLRRVGALQWLPPDPRLLLPADLPLKLLLRESALLHRADPGQVDRVLQRLDLVDCQDQGALSLSEGQARRAALARVALARPSLLLADEPTAGLDPPRRDEAWATLEAALPPAGVLVTATHDLARVRRRGYRLWALVEGRLVEDLPPGRPPGPLLRSWLTADGMSFP